MYLSKKDYFSIEGSESTRGYNTNKTLVHDYRMEPVPVRPVILPEIRFDLAKADLKGEFMDSLMDLYIVMENNPNIVVEIRSHTDCQPYIGLTNDTLSQRRAQTVVDYLVSRGIERERLVAKGYADRVPRVLDEDVVVTYNGKQYPFSAGTVLECDYIATLDPERQQAAHSLNRRLEFLVLRTDYVSRRLVENIASTTPVAQQTEEDILYFQPDEIQLHKGAHVRVHGGPFDGVEGILLKVKGHRRRRVVIQIDQVATIAAAEIEPDLIEILPE